MRKSIRKLAINRETVQTLRALDNYALANARGAVGSVEPCVVAKFETGNANCPARDGVLTGDHS
jgi:hypothetical protein